MNHIDALVDVLNTIERFYNGFHSEVELSQQTKAMEAAYICLQTGVMSVDWEHLNRELVMDIAAKLTKENDLPLRVARRLLQMIAVQLGPEDFKTFRSNIVQTIELSLGDEGHEGNSLIPRDKQKTNVKRDASSDLKQLFAGDPWLLPLYLIYLMGASRFGDFILRHTELVNEQKE